MLAAAQVEPRSAAQQFVDSLQGHSFVRWMFYRLPDLSQLGLLFTMAALWRQGAGWRMPATLVTVAALVALVGPQLLGSMATRVALGLSFVGFSTVAWRIAAGSPSGSQPD